MGVPVIALATALLADAAVTTTVCRTEIVAVGAGTSALPKPEELATILAPGSEVTAPADQKFEIAVRRTTTAQNLPGIPPDLQNWVASNVATITKSHVLLGATKSSPITLTTGAPKRTAQLAVAPEPSDDVWKQKLGNAFPSMKMGGLRWNVVPAATARVRIEDAARHTFNGGASGSLGCLPAGTQLNVFALVANGEVPLPGVTIVADRWEERTFSVEPPSPAASGPEPITPSVAATNRWLPLIPAVGGLGFAIVIAWVVAKWLAIRGTVKAPAADKPEAIFSEGTPFVGAEALQAWLNERSPQVCRIEVAVRGGKKTGTGFLVGPDLVLTNHHVVTDAKEASEISVTFDTGTRDSETAFNLATQWLVASAPMSSADRARGSAPSEEELDYALLRLEQSVGKLPRRGDGQPRGWINLVEPPAPRPGSMLAVLQHPRGQPLQFAIDPKGIVAENDNQTRIQHSVNTDNGSSGSPCFDEHFRFIGMHQGAEGGFAPRFNQAIHGLRLVRAVQPFLTRSVHS